MTDRLCLFHILNVACSDETEEEEEVHYVVHSSFSCLRKTMTDEDL